MNSSQAPVINICVFFPFTSTQRPSTHNTYQIILFGMHTYSNSLAYLRFFLTINVKGTLMPVDQSHFACSSLSSLFGSMRSSPVCCLYLCFASMSTSLCCRGWEEPFQTLHVNVLVCICKYCILFSLKLPLV